MTILAKYKIQKRLKEQQEKKLAKKNICLVIKNSIAKRYYILSKILKDFSGIKAVHETSILKDEIKELEHDFEYYNCGNVEYTRPYPPKKYLGGKLKKRKKIKLKKKIKK